jgi:shikimate dehydrogenase
MLKLAVVGNPVFHSRSPEIFKYLSSLHNLNLHYSRISCEDVNEVFDFAKCINLDGFNVTSPFKNSVIQRIDKLDYQAVNLNSVNTVLFSNNEIKGYNTDYFGVLKTIWNDAVTFNNKKVLILGAGAAARTAVFAVRNLNSKIFIWNRNIDKAKKIAFEFGIEILAEKDLHNLIDEFDFVISTIPPNSKILFELKFNSSQTIFDTVYHNSFFKNNQSKFGYKLVVGEKWLINQASLSFELFSGVKPNISSLFSYLQKNERPRANKYVLIGFSGAGKTSLGREIAEKFNFEFLDFDDLIEQKMKMTISEIFSNYGENYFRNLEQKLLLEINDRLQNDQKPYIISLGGGIIDRPENIPYIKLLGNVIWLYSSIEDSFGRISKLKNRPKLSNFNEAVELFDKRKLQYFLTSDFIFLNSRDYDSAKTRLIYEISRLTSI